MSDDRPGCGALLLRGLATLTAIAVGYAVSLSLFNEPRQWWHYLVAAGMAVPVGVSCAVMYGASALLPDALAAPFETLFELLGTLFALLVFPAVAIGAGIGLWPYHPFWMILVGFVGYVVAVRLSRHEAPLDRVVAVIGLLSSGSLAATGAVKWLITVVSRLDWQSRPAVVPASPPVAPVLDTRVPLTEWAQWLVAAAALLVPVIVAVAIIVTIVRKARGAR